MVALNFTLPLDVQTSNIAPTPLKMAMAKAVRTVLIEDFSQALQDLMDYGAPHIGSDTVIQRFTKQDGLAVLRRPVTSSALMRVIYANWLALGSERGLAFLEFVLQMLWADQWQIIRLWHRKSSAAEYPRYLSETEEASRFLTSRIRIVLDEAVDRFELSELAPVLRRLVPANIVPQVVIPFEADMTMGVALRGKMYEVFDFTPVL